MYNPFLTQYIELANLVLAQRAAILALSNEAARVSAAVNTKDTKALKKIEDLQKKYVQVQSQMMLFEVTAQEQGVEIFRKLIEQLYIPENNAALDREMENLRGVEDISNNRLDRRRDENLNTLILIISVFGLFLAAMDVVSGFFSNSYGWLNLLLAAIPFAVSFGTLRFAKSRFNRHK